MTAGPPLLLGEAWPGDAPGGLNRYLADLLSALRAEGLAARAVVLGPAAGAPPEVVTGGRAHDRIDRRLLRFNRAVRRAAGGAGVLDAHFALYAWWPALVGPTRRLPLVVHFQGPWAEESRSLGHRGWSVGAKWLVEVGVYRRADQVVVLSSAFKRLLVERYGVSPWKVQVIPPGVDVTRFDRGDRSVARGGLDLPVAAPVALVVRRLVPRMGLDTLLEAWRAVVAGVPDAQLLVAGDGPEAGPLRRLADRLGIAASVRFLGSVDERTLLACYHAADVAVVPTRALEGFGLVVLEALATGLPVVASDAAALPEVLAPLDPGLLVPAGDHAALAARLAGVLDGSRPGPSPEACRRYAAAFSWAAVAKRHLEVYRQAGAGRPKVTRVVYLDHCSALSGGELALVRLLAAMEGVEAHVILAEEGPLVPLLLQEGISVEVLTVPEAARGLRREGLRRPSLAAAWGTIRTTARVARRLRQLRPDLVHANSLKAGVYGGVAAKVAGVPFVWHVHDRIAADYLPAAAVRPVRAAIRVLADAVLTSSQTSRETLGRAAATARVVGCPVPAHEPGLDRRTDVGSPGRPLRIGLVGRLAPWKGQHLFLEAFARAFPSGDVTAVLVGAPLFGEEGYEREVRELIDRLGLSGRVELRGFRQHVQPELDRLDILVHASVIPEPFGQVVVEGMAAGLTVIAPSGGGPAEIVTDGVDGLHYPMGDVSALAETLRRAADDGGLRCRLGLAARARAGDFAPAVVAGRVTRVYQELLDAPRSPA